MTAVKSYMRGDLGGVFSSLAGVGKKVMGGNDSQEVRKQTKTSAADCIQWSGCKDSQTSADTSEAGKATGAMSFAFISALSTSALVLPRYRTDLCCFHRQVPSADLHVRSLFPLCLHWYLPLLCRQLLNTIRDELRGKYDQRPQLSWCVLLALKFGCLGTDIHQLPRTRLQPRRYYVGRETGVAMEGTACSTFNSCFVTVLLLRVFLPVLF